ERTNLKSVHGSPLDTNRNWEGFASGEGSDALIYARTVGLSMESMAERVCLFHWIGRASNQNSRCRDFVAMRWSEARRHLPAGRLHWGRGIAGWPHRSLLRPFVPATVE